MKSDRQRFIGEGVPNLSGGSASLKTERVHSRNGPFLNNNIDNLELWSRPQSLVKESE